MAKLKNGGFEKGSLKNWKTLGDTSIETASFGAGPSEGEFQALLTTFGSSFTAKSSNLTARSSELIPSSESTLKASSKSSGAVSDSDLEDFLSLDTGTLDSLNNGNVIQGSAIKQKLKVKAGDVVTFDWKFLTNELTFDQNPQTFNDFAFYTIDPPGRRTEPLLFELVDTDQSSEPFITSQTGLFADETDINPNISGFGTETIFFEKGGNYTIGFGVVDADDIGFDSGLLIDNVQIKRPPDLTIEFLEINTPDEVTPNSPGSVTVRVTNEGDLTAEDIDISLFASVNKVIEFNPNGAGSDAQLANLTIDTLEASEFQDILLPFEQVVVGPPGAFHYIASVDPSNSIAETNEGNNEAVQLVSLPGTNAVIDWSSTFLNAVQATPGSTSDPDSTPPFHAINSGIFHSAIFDAVRLTTEGGENYTSIFVDRADLPTKLATLPPGKVSAEAAVASAAFTVLSEIYPLETQQYLKQLRITIDEAIASGQSARSVALGQKLGAFVGEAVLAQRAKDGRFKAQSQLDLPPIDGSKYIWRPTTPEETTGLLPGLGFVDTFAIPNLEGNLKTGPVLQGETFGFLEFFPEPVPAFDSPEYAAELIEVQAIGGAADTAVTEITRTAEQEEIAAFWLNDKLVTSGPPGQWTQVAQELATSQNLDLLDSARLLAQMGTALGDSAITAWASKYYPELAITALEVQGIPVPEGVGLTDTQPRPSTLINFIAGTDSFDETIQDPDWEPLFENPNFPDYTSGHATFGGSASVILDAFFGDIISEQTPVDITTQEIIGLVRSYGSFEDAAIDNTLSRVYAGVHVTSSGVVAQEAGEDIATFVIQNIAQPIV
ncbi:MAG: hypothetical protein F6K58_15475 [Symploca sp. SIO2E9]|nr:hypothetical protein [Symploca sp. SIO2E9]